MDDTTKILAFATKGSSSNEEARLLELLQAFDPHVFPFDRSRKLRSGWNLYKEIARIRARCVVMEGTGVAGGLACIAARLFLRVPYVLSSGDAVGPWVASQARLVGPLFAVYEWLLCRLSRGFIGWTPYLVGRALTFGAPIGVTAGGWAPPTAAADGASDSRRAVRRSLGISDETIVFGMAGALQWSGRRRYCYGHELVNALRRVDREDIAVLIVGGGSGLDRLRELAGGDRRIHFVGPIPQEHVRGYLSAMDVGSCPQSVDGVGNFRYTTKVSEYLSAGLVVVGTRTPMVYDLFSGGRSIDDGFVGLPGRAPWDPVFVQALADWMRNSSMSELADRRWRSCRRLAEFDRELQVLRVTRFLEDILQAGHRS